MYYCGKGPGIDSGVERIEGTVKKRGERGLLYSSTK